MSARQILVVDDEVGIRELLRDILQDEGYQVRLAENAAQAREYRQQFTPDLVLLDIWMPDCDGISLLKEWGNSGLLTMPVVMMSGHGTIDTAVEATRIGAFDFLEKPIALQKLLKTVSAALKHSEQLPKSDIHFLRLGKSALINELRASFESVALHKSPVLLSGEQFAGTHLYVKFFHRHDTPWMVLDELDRLSSEPLALLQELEQGVLLISELAELSRTQQKGLNLLIANAEKHQVRVICATALSLNALLEQQLDSQLLQILSANAIQLPILNQHKDDIPDIVRALGVMLGESNSLPYRDFDTAALNALRKFDWPGNLSQLDNMIRTLMQSSKGERVTEDDVKRIMLQFQPEIDEAKQDAGATSGVNLDQPLREARDAFERLYFEHHIQKAERNMSKVAENVEMERTHLYRKLKQLGIKIK
jgi:two-component system, NtrC family, nitrogen regulation response regulator NtrX